MKPERPSPYWTCLTCGAMNLVAHPTCEACATARIVAAPPEPERQLPMYREFPAVAYQQPGREERCTEPGCSKTVGEHMADCRRLVTRIGRP